MVTTGAPVSVLLPSTQAVLRTAKDAEPMFKAGAWETWHEKLTPGRRRYARGPLHLYPRTDGRFVVLDTRRPWNDQPVSLEANEADAAEALDRIADAEGLRWDEEPAGPPIYPSAAPPSLRTP